MIIILKSFFFVKIRKIALKFKIFYEKTNIFSPYHSDHPLIDDASHTALYGNSGYYSNYGMSIMGNPNYPQGSHPLPRDAKGQTPIHIAAQEGYDLILRELIPASYYSPNIPDISTQTPIYMAAKNGHVEAVKVLVEATERYEDPNITYSNHETPIQAAARYGFT